MVRQAVSPLAEKPRALGLAWLALQWLPSHVSTPQGLREMGPTLSLQPCGSKGGLRPVAWASPASHEKGRPVAHLRPVAQTCISPESYVCGV